jgi:predicted aspartyl protease
MRLVTAPASFVMLLSVCLPLRAAGDQGKPPGAESADTVFKAGKFAEAGKLYLQAVASDPSDYRATVCLGHLALLSNRLDEARKWLERAVELRPDEVQARIMLAEACYRRDDFARAAVLLRAAGQHGRAKMLASFEGRKPYEVEGKGDTTTVKFVATDPLPLVRVYVNGGKEVTFFLDTGAPEVILDADFARELAIPLFGSEEGTFAGGKRASVGFGRIDSLTLGGWVIRNVPVGTLNTRALSKVLGAERVDGAIGTVLFYHFLTTLDYPRGELVLRRNTGEKRRPSEADRDGGVVVPFWMAGDHFMVAWGRVERREPVLLFVDTGLAGAGVNLTQAVRKDAGIRLLEDQATEGVGGGGKVRSVPFVVKELSLGGAREENVRGLYDGPFRWENTFGFRLGGMIGHQFFRSYATTFDFTSMRLTLKRRP